MELNQSNYHSIEMNQKYFSASQFKSFMDCEERTREEIEGRYTREKTTALLVGGYVDAFFEGTFVSFQLQNSEIFTLKGDLKAEYKRANYIINRVQRDELFMKTLQGEKQVIFTKQIDGIWFKGKFDSYEKGVAITDLKVVKGFDREWQDGLKISFVEKWKYDIQLAIYQELEGNKLPMFISAVTKETEPDLAVISIPQVRLDFCLDIVKRNIERFDNIKKKIIDPKRCETCDYCKSTKVLKGIISYEDIGV